MKVSELLLRLKDADQDAVVLLLPAYADATEAFELRQVVVVAEPWTCERHRSHDGMSTDVHYPTGDGRTPGWNSETDECLSERVVILSPQSGGIRSCVQEEASAVSDASSFRARLRQQALQARRRMVSDGRIISESEFRERLGVSQKRFARLLEEGSVFGIDAEGNTYYPAVLADPKYNRARIQEICRIIVPAADSRLDFLESRRGSLGDRSPLEMLNDDDDFALLRRVAKGWAAEYSRTVVRLFDGTHETEPVGIEPMYTAAVEIDPRKPIWDRASAALLAHGYQWPLGPYPETRSFTGFVEHQNVGDPEPLPDACVQIVVDGELVRVRIIFKEGMAPQSQTVPAGKHKSVVDVAKMVIAYLRKR